jgi:hypothetical protein
MGGRRLAVYRKKIPNYPPNQCHLRSKNNHFCTAISLHVHTHQHHRPLGVVQRLILLLQVKKSKTRLLIIELHERALPGNSTSFEKAIEGR